MSPTARRCSELRGTAPNSAALLHIPNSDVLTSVLERYMTRHDEPPSVEERRRRRSCCFFFLIFFQVPPSPVKLFLMLFERHPPPRHQGSTDRGYARLKEMPLQRTIDLHRVCRESLSRREVGVVFRSPKITLAKPC